MATVVCHTGGPLAWGGHIFLPHPDLDVDNRVLIRAATFRRLDERLHAAADIAPRAVAQEEVVEGGDSIMPIGGGRSLS